LHVYIFGATADWQLQLVNCHCKLQVKKEEEANSQAVMAHIIYLLVLLPGRSEKFAEELYNKNGPI
jgi:hypothetical protein